MRNFSEKPNYSSLWLFKKSLVEDKYTVHLPNTYTAKYTCPRNGLMSGN